MEIKMFFKYLARKLTLLLAVSIGICTVLTCLSKKTFLMEQVTESVNEGKRVMSLMDLEVINNYTSSNLNKIASSLGILSRVKPNSIIEKNGRLVAPSRDWAVLGGTGGEDLLCDMSIFDGIDYYGDLVVCTSYWRNSNYFVPEKIEIHSYDEKKEEGYLKDKIEFEKPHYVNVSGNGDYWYCCDTTKIISFSCVQNYSEYEIDEDLGGEYKRVEDFYDASVYYKSIKGFLKYECYEYVYDGAGDYRMITKYEVDAWKNGKKVLLPVYITFSVVTVVVAAFLALIDYKKREKFLFQKNLTSSLAHDLKSPLMVISGYVENITENTNPEKNEAYVKSIGQNVVHMNEIIQNILHLNELENKKKKKMTMDKCQIAPIVKALLEMKQKQMGDKNVEAVIVGDATIKCNKDAISRALDNLLSNAVNYSEPGKKVDIIIDTEQLIINNYFSGDIECSIKKLTEPFVKGSESRTSGGTGLGLNIAKSVMDIHGFKMRIEIDNNIFKIRVKW